MIHALVFSLLQYLMFYAVTYQEHMMFLATVRQRR